METNTFIFGFSLAIFVVGIVIFLLTARDFTKMQEKDLDPAKEAGPRAVLFNKLFQLLSEESESSDEARIEKIRQLIEKE